MSSQTSNQVVCSKDFSPLQIPGLKSSLQTNFTEVCSEDFSPSSYLKIEQSSKYSQKGAPFPSEHTKCLRSQTKSIALTAKKPKTMSH